MHSNIFHHKWNKTIRYMFGVPTRHLKISKGQASKCAFLGLAKLNLRFECMKGSDYLGPIATGALETHRSKAPDKAVPTLLETSWAEICESSTSVYGMLRLYGNVSRTIRLVYLSVNIVNQPSHLWTTLVDIKQSIWDVAHCAVGKASLGASWIRRACHIL